jgi:soluble lytic murein transglycosylase
VYGLMRQESRFVMNAKSSVGAKGLMQLMPATAKWVAKKINLANFHPNRVTEMDTNVTLGTHYMKMVLDSLDNHPVLASAAYNAGPGRARRWRADQPLEGAIYAETIPFSETRDYVKKVMSNAVYYNALFEGRPQSLKAGWARYRARGQGENGVEQLP